MTTKQLFNAIKFEIYRHIIPTRKKQLLDNLENVVLFHKTRAKLEEWINEAFNITNIEKEFKEFIKNI